VAKVALKGTGGGLAHGWASTVLTGSGTNNAANCVCADGESGSVFLVGGNDYSVGPTIYQPVVWRVVDGFGLFSAQTLVAMGGVFAAGPAHTVRIVAASPTYKVACEFVGGNNLMWRWRDGAAVSTVVTPPTTDEIKDVLWLPEDRQWLAISQSGGNVVKFWKSADAATASWTQVTTTGDGTSVWAAATVYLSGACVRGSIIMVPALYGGVPIIMVSGDLGVSWEALACPLARHQTLAPVPVTQRVRNLGPRFIAAGYSAASKVAHALTMRAG
jgi:hypothetical protein